MRRIIILFVFAVLMMASQGWSEYYQYKDDEGNLRFTDDPVNIPEDQRAEVKTFESVQREPAPMMEETNSVPVLNQPESEVPSSDGTTSSDAWEDRIVQSSEELDQTQEEIQRTAKSLHEEQEALKSQAPGDNASPSEKALYFEKVSVLNAKIDEYNKQREAFDQKVKTFNAQTGRGGK
jgi:hypothetical protein